MSTAAPLFQAGTLQASGLRNVRMQAFAEPEANDGHPAVLLTYDRSAFDPQDFAHHALALPDTIRRSVPRRQAEFFMGRLAARAAMQRLGHATEPVGTGPSREPLWPPGLKGSITHAGPFAAALVVPADDWAGVGIDIEEQIAPETLASIEDTVLQPSEIRFLTEATHRAEAADRLTYAAVVTLAFSAKESFFKATFASVGRYFDFHAVEVTALDLRSSTVELTVIEPLTPVLAPRAHFEIRFARLGDHAVMTRMLW